jgi:hypothetical protein
LKSKQPLQWPQAGKSGFKHAARARQNIMLGQQKCGSPLQATTASSTQVGARWRANFLPASAKAAMISAHSRSGGQFQEEKTFNVSMRFGILKVAK